MTSQPTQETIPLIFVDDEGPRARALANGCGWSSSDIRDWTGPATTPEEVAPFAPAATAAPVTTSLRGRHIERTDNALRALEHQPTPEEVKQTAAVNAPARLAALSVSRLIAGRSKEKRVARREGRHEDIAEIDDFYQKLIDETLKPLRN